jgi:hypothetical protein
MNIQMMNIQNHAVKMLVSMNIKLRLRINKQAPALPDTIILFEKMDFHTDLGIMSKPLTGKTIQRGPHVLIPCIGTAGKTLIFMFFAPKEE